MSKIAIIIGSSRTGRVGAKVEAWINPILKGAAPDVTFTTVDVSTFKLPVFDESVIPAMVPAMAQWTKPHSAAWSDEIAKYDGYVLVANEYNFGVSGSTKNAIDYLYHAWIGKPILIITYGIFGATNASDQLKTILTGMKTRPVETRPQLGFYGGAEGPDLHAAMGGELGEETKKVWENEKKADILKGLEELKTFLRDAQPVGGK